MAKRLPTSVLLRVTNAAVSNYRVRHADTVPPDTYRTPDGRVFYDRAAMAAWLAWAQAPRKRIIRGCPVDFAAADQAVDALRAELENNDPPIMP